MFADPAFLQHLDIVFSKAVNFDINNYIQNTSMKYLACIANGVETIYSAIPGFQFLYGSLHYPCMGILAVKIIPQYKIIITPIIDACTKFIWIFLVEVFIHI